MSTARRDLHITAKFVKPLSETSEPERSSISQELSAKERITESSNNFLLRAIAAMAAYKEREKRIKTLVKFKMYFFRRAKKGGVIPYIVIRCISTRRLKFTNPATFIRHVY